jgi:hypothetical protein
MKLICGFDTFIRGALEAQRSCPHYRLYYGDHFSLSDGVLRHDGTPWSTRSRGCFSCGSAVSLLELGESPQLIPPFQQASETMVQIPGVFRSVLGSLLIVPAQQSTSYTDKGNLAASRSRCWPQWPPIPSADIGNWYSAWHIWPKYSYILHHSLMPFKRRSTSCGENQVMRQY